MTYSRSYCYRIDFKDGFVYFGARACRCCPAEDTSYWGSPKTHKAKWLTDIPRVKTIVSEHESHELALEAEAKLIRAFWAVSKPLSLNAAIRGTKFNTLGKKPAQPTEETRARMSVAHKGAKWYTDGATDTMLAPDEAIPSGFERGRTNHNCSGDYFKTEKHLAYMRSEQNPGKKLENREKAAQLMTEMSRANNPGKKPENRLASSARMAEMMNKPESKEAASARAKIQVTCPWCNKTGNKPPMLRYHFDRCLEHPKNKGLTRKQIKELYA